MGLEHIENIDLFYPTHEYRTSAGIALVIVDLNTVSFAEILDHYEEMDSVHFAPPLISVTGDECMADVLESKGFMVSDSIDEADDILDEIANTTKRDEDWYGHYVVVDPMRANGWNRKSLKDLKDLAYAPNRTHPVDIVLGMNPQHWGEYDLDDLSKKDGKLFDIIEHACDSICFISYDQRAQLYTTQIYRASQPENNPYRFNPRWSKKRDRN